MANRIMIVPKGSAAVDEWVTATVLRNENMTNMGPGKRIALSVVFHTQFVPPICEYILTDTYPPIPEVSAYKIIAPTAIEPRCRGENTEAAARRMKRSAMTKSWTPVPSIAANKSLRLGKRNTSPWINFHPDSSSVKSSLPVDAHVARKVVLETRMRMMARNAGRRMTRTNELMIESQWISELAGKSALWYRCILSPYLMSDLCHETL